MAFYHFSGFQFGIVYDFKLTLLPTELRGAAVDTLVAKHAVVVADIHRECGQERSVLGHILGRLWPASSADQTGELPVPWP